MSTTTLPAPAAAPGPGEDLRADITTALDKLAAFGSADQIAEHLQQELIRGVCGDPGLCAVAAYLERVVPGLGRRVLVVTSARASAVHRGLAYDSSDVTVGMPAVVAEFIRRFDKGSYPGLTRLT